MENIKLNEQLINKFFGGLDSDCLEQVKALVKQGAFFIDEDEKPYQVGSEKLVVASRKNPYGDGYQYICIEESPMGSDGWDSAMAWDPNSKECYGTECRVYKLQIEVEEGEWEEFPIWFEDRESATIFLED